MAHGFRRVMAAAVAAAALGVATPAAADDYDPHRSGHPLRFLAYVVHPIGYALDFLIFRPAHWLISHPQVADWVGHTDDSES